MLAEIPDPRKKKGLHHPLAAMIALTVVGLLCGQRSYTQIAKGARLHPDLRNALGFTTKQTPELLKVFDIAGKVITTDALLTQRKFCQEILNRHADDCLSVKANQKQLYADIRDLFEPFDETDPPEVSTRRFKNLHADAGAPFRHIPT